MPGSKAAAKLRQGGLECGSASVQEVTVKAPGPAGRPVCQARVTTWDGSESASREHSLAPAQRA